MDFLTKLVKNRQFIEMTEEEQRLELLREAIDKRRSDALELANAIKNTFFFRKTYFIEMPEIYVGSYKVTTDSFRDGVTYQNVDLTDRIKIRFYIKSSGYAYYRYNVITVLEEGKTVFSCRWVVNNVKKFTSEPGDWHDIVWSSIRSVSKRDKTLVMSELEATKRHALREAKRNDAIRQISDLENRFGISITEDGKVLDSKEEITLDKFRREIIQKLERGEKIEGNL